MKYVVLLFVLLASTFTQASPFFDKPDIVSAQLSPSGKSIALISGIKDNQSIDIFDVVTKERTKFYAVESLKLKEASLRKIFWLGDKYLAAEIGFKREGIKHLLNTKAKIHYFIFDTHSNVNKPKVYKINARGLIVDPLIEQPNFFLFSKRGVNSKVYKLDIRKLNVVGKRLSKLERPDGGQLNKKNEVATVKGGALKWFISSEQQVKSVLYYDNSGLLRLSKLEDEGSVKGSTDDINAWKEVVKKKKKKKKKTKSKKSSKGRDLELNSKKKSKQEAEPESIAFAEMDKSDLAEITEEEFVKLTRSKEKPFLFPAVRLSEGKYYSYDISEDELRRIYLVDYLNKSLELAYETTAYKISSFDTDEASGRITSVNLLKEGQLQTDYIDESGESYLLGSESGLNVVLAKNKDETVSLTYSESINNSGIYSVITESGPSEVGRVMPSLAGVKPVRLVKETLKQDDIEFEYLLTIPDALNNPAPLIVMPHGGPIGVFDDQFFDRQSRFLNDNGYAVLRVNYRGSGGYSKALLEAGKGEFGEGMLTDIHTATLHASQRKDIDRSKICLAGFSYGGYASTMLAIKHPDSYKCAVTVAGVADWYLSLTSTRLSQYQYQWVKEYVGDISTDVEQIQQVSPIHHVKDLQVPIMIMHGKEDKVVDVEHAFRLRYKLEQANKPYEWHVFEKSGHHFKNDDDLNIVFDKMINFIATQMEN